MTHINLRERYKYLLAGFENFNFTDEQLQQAVYSFENARLDMESCMACQGDICKCLVNRQAIYDYKTGEFAGWDYKNQSGGRFYYALSPEGSAITKRPNFALFQCPGVVKRKEEISAIFRMVKNREEQKEKARIYE